MTVRALGHADADATLSAAVMRRDAVPSLAAAVRTPRLTAPQLALLRCWAEGLDLCAAWQRFLPQEPRPDPRSARAMVGRWRSQLATLARAHGHTAAAVLLRRDPEAMAEPAAAPTLDEFRAAQPEDFYSESELLALYQAEHGRADARSATRRRQRLRQRLLAVLQGLERLAVARQAQATDPLAQWLDERLAARLAAVGLTRVADLLQHLHTHGPGWHAAIPRVGPQAAARIQAWLLEACAAPTVPTVSAAPPDPAAAAPTLAAALSLPAWLHGQPMTPPWALPLPAAARATGGADPPTWPLAPLERLALPPLPSPSPAPLAPHRWPAPDAGQAPGPRQGHPQPQPQSPVQAAPQAPPPDAEPTAAQATSPLPDDLAAVRAWLALVPAGTATWRAYRKECERYLLWAVWVCGKPLAALTPADVQAYVRFLRQPDAGWCAPRQAARHTAAWRPFEGPLAPRSQQAAISVLRRFSAWMCRQGHVPHDPWAAALAPRSTPQLPPSGLAEQGRAAIAQAPTAATAAALQPPRALQAADLDALLHWCAQAPSGPRKHRQQAVLHLLLDGLRLRELAQATTADLRFTPSVSEAPWQASPSGPDLSADAGLSAVGAPTPEHTVWLRVSGRGPARLLRLSPASQAALARHWQDRGLCWPPPLAQAHAAQAPTSEQALTPDTAGRSDQPTPLVSAWPVRGAHASGLGESQLYQLLRQVCVDCAHSLLAELQAAHLAPANFLTRRQRARRPTGLPATSPAAPAGVGQHHEVSEPAAAGVGPAADTSAFGAPSKAPAERQAQALRLQSATPQALRRAAAAAALQLGAPLRQVQQRLGHRSLASTAALLAD